MDKLKDERRMTLSEYQDKYTQKQNNDSTWQYAKLIILLLSIFLFACLFSVVKNCYDINKYFGLVMLIVAVIIYVVFYIVPLLKIINTRRFKLDLSKTSLKNAKKHNKKIRYELSSKFIDYSLNVENGTWYKEANIKGLMRARENKDDKLIKKYLTEIYNTDVNCSTKDLILKNSVKSGIYSAVSQTGHIDAVLVLAINMQMIKDIVFMYGFRPNDAKLAKIFSKVLRNALVAFGLEGVNVGNSVAKTMGGIVKGIPLLGSAISVLVDSSVQGLSNATLTAVIGYNTIKYLKQEYNLQNILDEVVMPDSDIEMAEVVKIAESQLKTATTTLEKSKKAI